MSVSKRLHTIFKHVASAGAGMSVAGLGMMSESSQSLDQWWYALCHAGRGLDAVGQAGFNTFENGNVIAGAYLMGLLFVIGHKGHKEGEAAEKKLRETLAQQKAQEEAARETETFERFLNLAKAKGIHLRAPESPSP